MNVKPKRISNFLKKYLPFYEGGRKTECYWHDHSFIQEKIYNHEVYTEFEKNKLVGVELFTIEKDFGMIRLDAIAVHPDFRNKKIGKKLVKKVEQRAKRRKIELVSIGSLHEYKALNFYIKLGYKLDIEDEYGYEFSKVFDY